MLLGVHISAGNALHEAPERAHALGCNTMQIFSRNPQQWRDNFLEPQEIEAFNRNEARYKLRPLSIHIPYLINLASPDRHLYQSSIEAYIEDVLEAHMLKADYIVTHMGSHKKTSEEAGIARLVKALNRIIEKTSTTKVDILLENTAGSGSWLGYKFIHQKMVLEGIKGTERIGLCLDTAHAYLAGYNIATKEGLGAMLGEIDSYVGLDKLKLIHLNDAQDKLGSRHDRHQHIGKGYIGVEGMRRIVNHKKLRNLPFILETPKDTQEADKMNLDFVRALRN